MTRAQAFQTACDILDDLAEREILLGKPAHCSSTERASRDRIDLEAARVLAPLPTFPHSGIGHLNVAAETIGVEQRTCQSVRVEFAADRLQRGRRAGKLKSQALILFKAARRPVPAGPRRATGWLPRVRQRFPRRR